MTEELRKVFLVIIMIGALLHCSAQSSLDKSNMTIGKIGSDGYVYNRSNMTVGRFKSDGYIVDRNNMTIGRAKDVPVSYAAVFFFFNLFQ